MKNLTIFGMKILHKAKDKISRMVRKEIISTEYSPYDENLFFINHVSYLCTVNK
eukprot:TRINITY_DN1263_c0_g1_i5.p3 TRINITY_DN1263_c0_g1~~TRINITY_DN1263_c0_g1_i5.p3  ORF type:complete len:54 (-),score=4.34 TRINITY_DN1263_c0_g1_i5:28-189(-)